MKEGETMNWNLTSLYESFESEAFHEDFKAFEAFLPILNQWANQIENNKLTTSEILVSYIQYKTSIRTLSAKLGTFASLSLATDSKNVDAIKCLDRVRKISGNFTKAFTIFQQYLKALDISVLESTIEH